MAQTVEDIDALLVTLRARIADIEAGLSSYSIAQRNVVNHQLETLYGRERELMRRRFQLAGSGRIILSDFGGNEAGG